MSIEQAVADLTKLEARASKTRAYIDMAREYAEAKPKQETDGPASTTAFTSDTSNGRSKTRRAMNMVVDLIRTAGRPISTNDLLAQMEQQGMILGGQSRKATLSNLLSRDQKRVVTSSKLGWRLVEWGDDPPDPVRPKRQRRPRNSRRTKKAAQDQQGGMATWRNLLSGPAYRV